MNHRLLGIFSLLPLALTLLQIQSPVAGAQKYVEIPQQIVGTYRLEWGGEPYLIQGQTSICKGSKLVVEPGVQIYFRDRERSPALLLVYGEMEILAGDIPVILQRLSYKKQPAETIVVASPPDSETDIDTDVFLRNVVVLGAQIISVFQGNLTIENSSFLDGSRVEVREGAGASLNACSFVRSGEIAVDAASPSRLEVLHCRMQGPLGCAVRVNGTTSEQKVEVIDVEIHDADYGVRIKGGSAIISALRTEDCGLSLALENVRNTVVNAARLQQGVDGIRIRSSFLDIQRCSITGMDRSAVLIQDSTVSMDSCFLCCGDTGIRAQDVNGVIRACDFSEFRQIWSGLDNVIRTANWWDRKGSVGGGEGTWSEQSNWK